MKKRIVSGLVGISLAIFLSPCAIAASSFADVPETHWAYGYVEKAAENQLVQGIGNNRYGVEDSVSNAEWATMLCNLFYADSIESYKKLGGRMDEWWMPYLNVGQQILGGTEVMSSRNSTTFEWDTTVVNAPISRYDMAQVIYNVAKHWDAPNTEGTETRIGDWASVPQNYQAAVAYCFAAGFVTGVDASGTFQGNDSMTRGAAAVVLCRMLDAKNGTNTPDTGSFYVTVQGAITQTSDDIGRITITVDSSYTQGKLANGAEINEENILNILGELEAIFPAGTSWGTTSSPDQYYRYVHSSWGPGGACMAWSSMPADLLYGTGAPYTAHHDLSVVKAGDIVKLYDAVTKDEHWVVVMGTTQSVSGTPYMVTCEGNVNGKVTWHGESAIPATTAFYPNSIIYSFY